MKNFSLSIPQPCTEKWGNFTPAAQGGYCSSCSKVVVDFTKKSDKEILDFFAHKAEHTCGRFRPGQMKSYVTNIPPIKINPGMTLLKAGFMSLLFLLINKQTSAQEVFATTKTEMVQYPNWVTETNGSPLADKVIRGIVTASEDGSSLPGVNIVVKGTTNGTVTDAEGRFEFHGDFEEGDVLVFTFIGLRSQEFVIKKGMSEVIEIRMELEMMVLGEVAVAGVYEGPPSAFQKLWSKVKEIF